MKYLSCAETAKLIRQALKQNFPLIKFSVYCKRGGSINVTWNNGPTTKQVDKIAGQFEGSGFDGMQDLSYPIEHYITKDGTVCLAEIHHNLDHKKFEAPPDSEKVQFGSRFVFCYRNISPQYTKEVAEKIANDYGLDAQIEIKRSGLGGDYCEVPYTHLSSNYSKTLNQAVNDWFNEIDLT